MFRSLIFLIIFFTSPHVLASDMDSTKKNIVNKISAGLSSAFGTSLAVFAEEYSDGSCFMDFFYPQSTISITE